MDEELQSGVIYEPRVLWDVARQANVSVLSPGTNQIKFSKYNLRNGGQYPIELRQMLIAPVGYTFAEYDGQHDPPTLSTGDYGACAAVLQKSSIMISVPNRQHYALEPLQISTWLQEPTADVSMRYSVSDPGASGLHGVNRWTFDEDRCLILPRNAACTFQLGPLLQQPDTNQNGVALASLAFYEDGVGHGGSRDFMRNSRARMVGPLQLHTDANTASYPFQAADGLGASAQGDTGVEWPGDTQLTFQDYKHQEVARDGYNKVAGFSVAINQINFDDQILGSALANASTGRMAPVSLRLPCRARCDAMSQEWWWRDGAPLALVCPTLTPALVYRLPEPITLHKGDHLEVEMQSPGGRTFGQNNVFSIYQMGIGFAGYAAIRG